MTRYALVALACAALVSNVSGAQTPCELAKLTDDFAPAYLGIGDPEDFGASLSLSGTRLLVGNPGSSSGVSLDGSALVYELDGLNWFRRDELESPGYEPGFGAKVALDGDVAVVGDGINDLAVFERGAGGWSEAASFSAPNQFQQLGRSVAVDGDRFLAGAAINPNGLVRVFERGASTWSEVDQLIVPPNLFDSFGAAVALEDDVAVVGSPNAKGPGGESGIGAVRVFEFDGEDWTETAFLQPATLSDGGGLGTAVAISSERIVAGAPGSDAGVLNGGAVFVYVRSGSTWVEEDLLFPADVSTGDGVGRAVALLDERLVAGAPGRDAGASNGAGGAHVFDRDVLGWSEVETLVPAGRGLGDAIGSAVATGADLALLGSPGDDDAGPEYGAVYAMSVSGTTCRTLDGFPARLSVASGGTLNLQLRAGFAHAGRTYWLAGSLGTSPGFAFKGFQIPLVPDPYLRFSLAQANTPSFVNTLGTLNGSGRANAQVLLPPGAALSLAGLRLHHAFLVFEGAPSGPLRHVSSSWVTWLDP